MTRPPLFRDAGEDDQREDGYSEPHGFLIGECFPPSASNWQSSI